MFIIIFAIIDLVIGVALAASFYFDFTGHTIIFYLAIVGIIKGLYSILAGVAAGFFYDVIGWLDLAAGILLWIATLGFSNQIFLYLGIIIILKGIYSFIIGLVSQN